MQLALSGQFMKKVFIVFLLFIAGGAFLGIQGASLFKNQSDDVVSQSQSRDEVVGANTEEAVVPVGTPQSLSIPKINIDAVVESGGLDAEKNPVLPKDADNVLWYDLGKKPGEMGSAVISGHWDKETGAPAVFYDLKKLAPGDEITIKDSDNQQYTFKVTKVVDYPYDKVPLEEVYAGQSDVPLLNLITCGGAWNASTKLYSHRTVVYSELAQ